jgi:hypothetical protein
VAAGVDRPPEDGARLLVDEAAQNWLPEDPFAVEVCSIGVAIVVSAVGDALGDAPMWPGRVVGT